MTLLNYFFDLTSFRCLGQKSKKRFHLFLVQMRTRKFAFEINLPLAGPKLQNGSLMVLPVSTYSGLFYWEWVMMAQDSMIFNIYDYARKYGCLCCQFSLFLSNHYFAHLNFYYWQPSSKVWFFLNYVILLELSFNKLMHPFRKQLHECPYYTNWSYKCFYTQFLDCTICSVVFRKKIHKTWIFT